MVRVLVVDDDKMARQGLILSIRWEDFGMKVVGEAPNGVKALQFLDENPVDLVLTDLAMPVMSGIELMKHARTKPKDVLFVVLTFHEDFEYTREALRLGAIDYISKLQLEKENLDTVLARIRDRFSGELKGERNLGGNSAVAFFAVSVDAQTAALRATIPEDAELSEVGPGLFLGRFDKDSPPVSGWYSVRLQGLLGETRPRVEHLLRRYQTSSLFYDYNPAIPVADLTLEALEKVGDSAPSDPTVTGLRRRLCSMEWMHNPELFEQVTSELKSARLPFVNLIRLLAAVESEWNRVFAKLTSRSIELTGSFLVWNEVEAWLEGIRNFTYSSLQAGGHSPEAKAGALRALRIIHEEYATPLHAQAVAQRVNQSRSHFCLCFKQIVGESFLDCLSAVRLEKARELLRNSDLPVYEIAERTGYADERYFSRLFRKATGVLPRDFRKTAG